ncbi:hypothetical protein BA895_09505 [Humibacillus sp. DSM 29435]|uniref:hypothetical protein n=1 Tax=Humibacillus sp. DSM 29435 TaxID=1869167 RepID=UPI000872A9A3|nr:hypothetical protein [Humibacillus sp. DSM 29435]OFE14584.1 hypothetical protein BA895_09505 [Humibacillus sp. DSM 29435]
MHHANHFYGHAHIMARYVGLAEPPRIWGYLQHGWNMHDGFAVGTVFAEGYPKFVWSQACSRRGWAAGLRDYMVVGSPWLYLLELERQREWLAAAPPRLGTIVYPFHGWEGQQVVGSHAAYVEQVRATEGDVPITVCLHWNEYDNPKVRREYEDAGVRVITHGQRGYLWQDTDVAFLYRQLHEIRSHRRVVSNRMSSAILYAASAGADVGIYGDPMELEADHAVLGGVGKPRRLWPRLHQVEAPRDHASDVALTELGAGTVLLPEEVIDAFGWGPEIAVPGPPPPAPSLEQPSGRGRHPSRPQAGSHRGPADAEPTIDLGVVVTSAGDVAPLDAASSDEPDRASRSSHEPSPGRARGGSSDPAMTDAVTAD